MGYNPGLHSNTFCDNSRLFQDYLTRVASKGPDHQILSRSSGSLGIPGDFPNFGAKNHATRMCCSSVRQ